MTAERRLLAVLAHPDDEVFGLGATVAVKSAAGVQVVLVCATRGEAGEIAPGLPATRETLGQVREDELRCSAAALGINELILLDYRDSGMAGSPDNHDPRAFVNAPAAEVVATLVGIRRRVRPQVVITFDPDGAYGHPDHIAVHQHTMAAFAAAGEAGEFPDQGEAWQPARLFYNVFPSSVFDRMRSRMAELGLDTSQFDSFSEDDSAWWPDDQVHLTLDVPAGVPAKRQALACHQTQFSQDSPFRRLPETELKDMLSREHFFLARPAYSPDMILADLFDTD